MQCVIEAAMELGYSSMKPEQAEVAVALIVGRDVFAILPTGFGKSLCYACLPVAFDKCQKKERGYSIVVVVSPLVAVMKDQVRSGNGCFIYKTFNHFLHFKIHRYRLYNTPKFIDKLHNTPVQNLCGFGTRPSTNTRRSGYAQLV